MDWNNINDLMSGVLKTNDFRRTVPHHKNSEVDSFCMARTLKCFSTANHYSHIHNNYILIPKKFNVTREGGYLCVSYMV